jgi:hypothetical protein
MMLKIISLIACLSSYAVCGNKQPADLFDPLLNAAFSPDHFLSKQANKKLLDRYSPQELALIHADLLEREEALFAGATKGVRRYVATAGGPGAGKSTVLEKYMDQSGERCVYADPDRAALLHMQNTYKADLKNKARSAEEAYTHWRDASNFIANYILAKALREGYPVAHGTTMTAPVAILEKIFTTLKTVYGYSIELLHVSCNEFVRKESELLRRAGGVVQCSWEDFANKNTAFFARLPHYLAADQVTFFYRSKLEAVDVAATVRNGVLDIICQQGFAAIRQLHEENTPGVFNTSVGLLKHQ